MRPLHDALEQVMATGLRQPVFRLLAFDPALDSMTAIVLGTYTQTPLDLTPNAKSISWSPAQLSFTLSDPLEIFDPDSGEQRQHLANGAIIRLLQGDAAVAESDWIWIFTGLIRGQIGWQKNPGTQIKEAKVSVQSRENCGGYKRLKCTSKSYSAGTELGVFLYDVAQTFLGLDPREIRIPPTLGLQLLHSVNQVVQITPWEAISKLLETVGRAPYFDGDGRLTSFTKDMQRLPDCYLLERQIIDRQVPEQNQDTVNKVTVTFLDSALERVDGQEQKLGSAQVTTGFFSAGERLECWWSDDHKQRASGTYLNKASNYKSINSGFIQVGSESYQPIDDFHGVLVIEMEWWLPVLLTVMLVAYVAAALIPDGVVTVGVIGQGGVTIPVGRIIQAAAMLAIMMIMMQLGAGQYEIWGSPYDYAYLTRTYTAIQDGLERWQWVPKEIKNDFLGSYDQAEPLAILEWVWEICNAQPRRLIIEDNPALEIGDIVALPNNRKLLVADLSKSITPDQVPQLSLTGFKVLTV